LRIAPSSRQAGDVKLLLDRHRHAEKGPTLASRQGDIGVGGGLPSSVEVTNDDRVDCGIYLLDARDRLVAQLARGNLSSREHIDKLDRHVKGWHAAPCLWVQPIGHTDPLTMAA
jgi:hypothetical protein